MTCQQLLPPMFLLSVWLSTLLCVPLSPLCMHTIIYAYFYMDVASIYLLFHRFGILYTYYYMDLVLYIPVPTWILPSMLYVYIYLFLHGFSNNVYIFIHGFGMVYTYSYLDLTHYICVPNFYMNFFSTYLFLNEFDNILPIPIWIWCNIYLLLHVFWWSHLSCGGFWNSQILIFTMQGTYRNFSYPWCMVASISLKLMSNLTHPGHSWPKF